MSKSKKRLQKIRQNTKNVSMNELQEVLKDYGILLHRIKGDHHIFRYNQQGQEKLMSIPVKNPIKVVYVKKALKVIDVMEDENEEN